MIKTFFSLFIFTLLLTSSFQTSFAQDDGRRAISVSLKEQVTSLLEKNEQVHASMFNYKKEDLKKAVVTFKKRALEIKDKEVQKYLEPAIKASSELLKNKTKEEDNESYHRLSLALVKLVELYKIGSTYNIYYCPMVKKRWVQNSTKMRKVHNPYAPEMPHCGGQITEF